jgi:hypothetical protein
MIMALNETNGRAAMHGEPRGRLFGRRYTLPQPVAAALEQIFEEPVDAVIVIEHSRYAKLHRGLSATTRPSRILLAMSGAEFVASPELLLHEYYHVLCQWQTGYLTRWRYVLEYLRSGYWENRYEQEAREFAAAAAEQYCGFLIDPNIASHSGADAAT